MLVTPFLMFLSVILKYLIFLKVAIAAEMFDPPSLNWDQDKYLELQKDRGKNLERFLRWNFKEMKPGKTFTKANQWEIDVPYGSMQPEVKELPATLILRPFNYDTLAVSTYIYAAEERMRDAAAPSIAIILVGLIPIIIITRMIRSSRDKGAM